MTFAGTYEVSVALVGFTESKRALRIDAGMRLRVLSVPRDGFVEVEIFSENTLGSRVLQVKESDLRQCTRIKVR